VCPLIDESEEMPYQAAEETAAALAAALPDLRVGLVHGRMPPSAKEGTMRRFKEGKIQLLVATTVIEVGVDVPNATLMVIENAERMGLVGLCVPDAVVLETAFEVARTLSSGSRTAIRFTKHALNNWLRLAGPSFDASLALEMLGFRLSDAREGVDAVKSKRKPEF